MQTNDYLNSLQNDKQNLVTKLSEKGVTVTGGETFTELIPKLDEIQSGGVNISEYFDETISAGTSYSNALQSGWIKTLKKLPAFKFNGTSTAYMFSMFVGNEIDFTYIDTSNVNSMIYMFYSCNIEDLNLKSLNTSNVKYLTYMFQYDSQLVNLDISNFDMGNVIGILGMFNGCNNLEILKFGYDLGKSYILKTANNSQYTLDLSNSTKLTHDSLMSIINGLYDLNLTYGVYDEEGNELGGTLYTQKLVLGTANLAKLTAEEIALATAKGWSVS